MRDMGSGPQSPMTNNYSPLTINHSPLTRKRLILSRQHPLFERVHLVNSGSASNIYYCGGGGGGGGKGSREYVLSPGTLVDVEKKIDDNVLKNIVTGSSAAATLVETVDTISNTNTKMVAARKMSE